MNKFKWGVFNITYIPQYIDNSSWGYYAHIINIFDSEGNLLSNIENDLSDQIQKAAQDHLEESLMNGN